MAAAEHELALVEDVADLQAGTIDPRAVWRRGPTELPHRVGIRPANQVIGVAGLRRNVSTCRGDERAEQDGAEESGSSSRKPPHGLALPCDAPARAASCPRVRSTVTVWISDRRSAVIILNW